MSSELAALNADWLVTDTVTATNTGTSVGGISSTATYFDNNTGYWTNYSYPYPYYVRMSVDHRPIRLTLPEVERLRLAAKRDAKLKAILAKFTDQIEVELTFE